LPYTTLFRSNTIDQPERFGDGWYTRILPGQSSIRLTFNPVSVGVSTENLWWGPGIHNSLLMTNTAPGFPHLTLNTTRPIRTYIGSFEGQVIGARLEGSGYPPTPLGSPDHYDKYYRPKSDDWRYLSGIALTYQPRWVKGLSLGMQRVFVGYHNTLGNNIKNYLPFFEPVNKGDYGSGSDSASADEAVSRDQLISVFARWLIAEANAEVYFGSGSNSQTLNVNWIRGMKRLGVQFERYVHNNDFFYLHNADMRRNWVDFSFALNGEWNYQRFIARSHLNIIKAFNYQYELEENS